MSALNALQHLGERLTNAHRHIGDSDCLSIDVYRQTTINLEAIRLIELGARANLVAQLTGMENAVAKRLYLQLNGHPSPPGQTPFTDAWFLQSNQRLLQASIAWRIDRRLRRFKRSRARRLIDVYESYRSAVRQPLLDITRVAFVPRLVNIGLWHRRACNACGNNYIGPVTDIEALCPGCRLYRRYRSLRPAKSTAGRKACVAVRRTAARRSRTRASESTTARRSHGGGAMSEACGFSADAGERL
jgi:hypothetical protein